MFWIKNDFDESTEKNWIENRQHVINRIRVERVYLDEKKKQQQRVSNISSSGSLIQTISIIAI